MTVALQASGLSVSYGKVLALTDASITLKEGSIVSVIGPNGAGKTTMLAALMGLHPSRGAVQYYGRSLATDTVEERVGQGLCLVPERRELFGDLNCRDNLLLGAFSRWRKGERQFSDSYDEVYRRFPRLKERSTQEASTLSGGERQMLAIGRAMMARPKVLMLDEPSLGLAPFMVREIFRIITSLRETGVSILLVEQNARAALAVADYGYVLENGAVTLEGPTSDLASNSRVIDTYLGRTAR
ncbi:MAG: ABC transporter ATP-binding protein [Rhizobiales bacterium]|nr:ABC transporter ATP-binding protein [Hyphomicrobiales bacterium]OJY44199.1 MAG: ABC transporter ATP-binding protein [Rhizobiales bacterium 64-17]